MSELTREFNIDGIDDVAKDVLDKVDQKIILFYGKMGVGKTTVINALVKAMGGTDIATSPTFSIVNEYKVENDIVYHFDFYRIKDVYEALDIGIEDYFDSGHWVFIEWPEKIEELLPKNAEKLSLSLENNEIRLLKLNSIDFN